MADIAPELYEKIKEIFDRKYARTQILGESLGDIMSRINEGTATFRDADMFAVEVGAMMADSMKQVLVLEDLPGGQLYRNIAQRTIGEGLKDTYGIMSNITATIQEEVNGREGIGLKAVKPKLEVDRVDRIVEKAAAAKTQESLDATLDESVPTFTRQVVDDSHKANARLHNKAGLKVTVEREYDGVGLHNGTDVCEWCLSRAGKFDYEKAMDVGAFERHEGCGCIITYTSRKGEVTRGTGAYLGGRDGEGKTTTGWKWENFTEKIDNPRKFEQNVIDNANKKAYTKINPSDIPSMDQKQFAILKEGLEKHGVAIIQDADGDAYLRAMNAEAMTLSDGSAVIFQSGRVPSASAVYEEIIHVGQIWKDGAIKSANNKEGTIEYLNREIAANEKLLRNRETYKLTSMDIKSIEENLEIYRKKLRDLENV